MSGPGLSLSDISSGTGAVEGAAGWTASSLDHAVRFHRPVPVDDRGGRLVASLTQETLARPGRR